MAQAGEQVRLPLEILYGPLPHDRVSKLIKHFFYRAAAHHCPEATIAGTVHCAHAAGSNQIFNLITTGK
jgi:hypothetical protein